MKHKRGFFFVAMVAVLASSVYLMFAASLENQPPSWVSVLVCVMIGWIVGRELGD